MSDIYLIWSNEHRAWWGPGRSGYETRIEHAGRYSREEAIDICTNAIAGTSKQIGMLPELPVREEDALAMLEYFVQMYPFNDPEPER